MGRDPIQASPALVEMLEQDRAAGIDTGLEEPRAPGPPAQTAPLIPATPPSPDWRAEEAERAKREQAERQAQLEPEPEAYPAKKKTAPISTPNLDKVREIQAEVKSMGKGAP